MNETIKVIFGLIGGLALFLYGMNSMSDALQKAAGERMKKILGFLTRNPVMGVLAGALVTAVLQSSSATTVMAFKISNYIYPIIFIGFLLNFVSKKEKVKKCRYGHLFLWTLI